MNRGIDVPRTVVAGNPVVTGSSHAAEIKAGAQECEHARDGHALRREADPGTPGKFHVIRFARDGSSEGACRLQDGCRARWGRGQDVMSFVRKRRHARRPKNPPYATAEKAPAAMFDQSMSVEIRSDHANA